MFTSTFPYYSGPSVDFLVRLNTAAVIGLVVGACAGCHGAGVHMWTTNRLTGSETERWCWEASTHLSTNITSGS